MGVFLNTLKAEAVLLSGISEGTNIIVPFWTFILGTFSLVGSVAAAVYWATANFFKRSEAQDMEHHLHEKILAQVEETKRLEIRIQEQIQRQSTETKDRIDKLSAWVARVDTNVDSVAKDTTYIRGWIDGQRKGDN